MDSIDVNVLETKFSNLLNNDIHIITGGSDSSKPTGGFLPIIECTRKDLINEENKNREFKSKKNSVSIKDIMTKRRDKTKPLFS